MVIDAPESRLPAAPEGVDCSLSGGMTSMQGRMSGSGLAQSGAILEVAARGPDTAGRLPKIVCCYVDPISHGPNLGKLKGHSEDI
jgi:hypothetical protein